MKSSNRLVISILVVAALAIGFWVLALGPKREEANELAGQVEEQRLALAAARSKAAEAVDARRRFPVDYRRLVTLGQAAPASDETASLLVELNHIANDAEVKFDSIQLASTGETTVAAPTAPTTPTAPSTETPSGAVPASTTVPPTEAAAAVTPLGASVGPAGLAVMPYTLSFSGDFFQIADFIEGIDSLVHTGSSKVAVDGRLVTLDGFALTGAAKDGFPQLSANFAVTTYLTPPGQGLTAGATSTAPAPAVTTPAEANATATEAATATSAPAGGTSETAAR
jgi:Tfp pilus assembly protein PilO